MSPGTVTNDGRADVVLVEPRDWEDLVGLRAAETLCADIGAIRLLPSLRATAAQVSPASIAAAIAGLRRLGLIADDVPLRLVVRLQSEAGFSRSDLRDAVSRRLRSRVTRGHERANEVWLIQDTMRTLRVGVRIARLEARRPARAVERPGALRPAVAAAMIGAAGDPPGRLLDPCCGSGTILAEAEFAGWAAVGGDHATDAVAAATANTSAEVVRLDARRLPFPDDGFDIVVSNLPFGHQYKVQGAPVAWYRRTLGEALRAAPRAVVLAPPTAPFRQALGRMDVMLAARHDVELLGRTSTIWVINRKRR